MFHVLFNFEQLLFIAILFAFGVAAVFQIIDLSKRFLKYNADFRAPYMIMIHVFSLFLIILFLEFVITGYISTILSYSIILYYVITATAGVRGRLLGYATGKIPCKLKNAVYTIYVILITILMIIGVYGFNIVAYQANAFSLYDYMITFNHGILPKISQMSTIIFSIIVLISCTIISIFDFVERRRPLYIFSNIILFLPMIWIILSIFTHIYEYIPATYLFAINIIYIIIPNIETYTETYSIIRRSKGYDARIYSIMKIIKNIDFSNLTSKNKYQLQLIYNIFDSDKKIRELCLSDRLISNNQIQNARSYFEFERLRQMESN